MDERQHQQPRKPARYVQLDRTALLLPMFEAPTAAGAKAGGAASPAVKPEPTVQMEAYFNETRGRDHDAVRDIFRVAGNLPEGAPAPDNPRLDDGGGKGLKGLEACEHWHTIVKGMLRSKKGITNNTKRFLFSFLRVHPA